MKLVICNSKFFFVHLQPVTFLLQSEAFVVSINAAFQQNKNKKTRAHRKHNISSGVPSL
jgi:hypothetical protein